MDPAFHPVFVQALRHLPGRRPTQEAAPEPGWVPADLIGACPEPPASRALTVLDAELRRIAIDLHDTAAQALAVARMSVEAIARAGATDGAERAVQALPVIDAAICQVRQLIVGLRPPLLDELGPAAALGWCLTNLTRGTDLVVELTAGGGLTRLPSETETACYRIGQEAIANAVRHASARRLTVRLDLHCGMLRLEVADDGRGMPATDGRPGDESRLGLTVMRERAAALGGHVLITSQPGFGTRVVAMLPIAGRAPS